MQENRNDEPTAGDSVPANNPLLSRRGLFKLSLVGGGALIVGPGFLAACSSDATSPGSSTIPAGSAGSSAAPTGSSDPSAAPSSGGETGGGGGPEITVGVVSDILSFDSYQNGTVNFIILQNLNTFLIDYDDDLVPKPAALSRWKFSDDHTGITLTLRDNLKLQTGKIWKAADLVQSFDRAADSGQGAQLFGPMSIVKEYKAVDDTTVEMTFNRPVAELLVTDLLENFPAMDGEKNNADYLATKPASGGPFQLESRDPGNTITVGRFPDFFDASAVATDKVTFRIFDNADSMVAALQSGALDVIYRFPAKNAAQLKDQFDIIEGYPGALIDMIRLNPLKPPYDKIEMRQAIARAVDRQRIIDEVYFGYGTPSFLPWGPNSPAQDAAYVQKNSFNLDEAKKLWEAAGSPPSGSAQASSENATALQMLQILQQDLKSIGFDLQIDTQDNQTFTKTMVAGEFSFVFGGIGNSSKSPSRISTNSLFRVTDNLIWRDKLPAEYVDAIAESEGATTPESAKAAYDKLNELLSRLAWGIPVCVSISLIAANKAVTGVSRDVDDRLVLKGAKKSM